MIEIVFSDSACGCLKAAQRCGEGEFVGEGIGVILGHSDGREPTQQEIDDAREEALKQMRAEWEAAVPLGGSTADIYGFSYLLSMGDISEDVPGEKRRSVLEWLYSVHPYFSEAPDYTKELLQNGKNLLEEVCGRISSGESVRVWYSSQPDEMCGLYWFLNQISELDLRSGQIMLVALPENDIGDNGAIISYSGWGGIKAGDWHRYIGLQKAASKAFCRHCSAQWKHLQKENAPLRAVLNGRLVSFPETLYDEFIVREIELEQEEFHEARLIGKVLGKYGLGISDSWIAKRIEAMVSDGSLTPISAPAKDVPGYHRLLRRNIDLRRV